MIKDDKKKEIDEIVSENDDLEKSDLLKKKDEQSLKSALICFVSLTLAAGTLCGITLAKTNDYSSQKQIECIADGLDSDLSVMKLFSTGDNHVVRLKHNDGDPIYVKFQSGYPKKYEKMAKTSLDYVFQIVGGVNPLYSQYRFVNEKRSEQLKEQGKTVIEYTLNDSDESKGVGLGKITAFMDYESKMGDAFHRITNKSVVVNPEICINYETMEKVYDGDEAVRTYIHELFHVFGFGDVYNDFYNFQTSTFYGNTFMNASCEFPYILPNDYACIMAAYAPPMKNQRELKLYIEKCKEQLNNYKDFYYENLEDFGNKCISEFFDYGEKVDLSGEEIKSDFTFSASGSDGEHRSSMQVICSGDEYTITVFDEDGNVVDGATGKTRLVNGSYILEDAVFKTNYNQISLSYDGYLTDFVFSRDENSVYLYDVSGKVNSGEEMQNTSDDILHK